MTQIIDHSSFKLMEASEQNFTIAMFNYEDSELSAAVPFCNFSSNFSISCSLHLAQMLDSSDSAWLS